MDPLWKCYGGKLFMKLICKIDALTFAFAACDVIRWEALRFLFYFLHLVARKSRWVEIISDGEYWFSSDDFHKTSTVAIFYTLDDRVWQWVELDMFTTQFFRYSSVPNRRIGPNKRAGGKILKKH